MEYVGDPFDVLLTLSPMQNTRLRLIMTLMLRCPTTLTKALMAISGY